MSAEAQTTFGAPYEAITNQSASDPVLAAEAVLREGWSKRGWPVVRVGEGLPWDTEAPRSFAYALHAFDPAEPLLRAFDLTGEARFLSPVLDLAADWVARCGEAAGDGRGNPFAWYDMAVGMRSYRLAYAYRAGLASGALEAPSADAAALARTLAAHLAWLADDAHIAFHSNHGYYQVAGQLAAGRRLDGMVPGAAKARAQARRRLVRVVDTQFAADGCHKEHSPDYHRMVLETLRGLVRSGLDEDGALAERADAIEDALAWFVAPNGHVVNFGDSDDRDLSCPPRKAARWARPAMRWAVTNGQVGERPPETARAFRQGGYYVARVPQSQADPSQDSYLAMTACFHSRTHKQADDLSFVWYERGQPILIDAGRYGYVDRLAPGDPRRTDGFWYGDPMRRYVESTRAHNAVTVDGRNTPREEVHPYGSAIEDVGLQQDGRHEVQAAIKLRCGYWVRRLSLTPGRQLVVQDSVMGAPAQSKMAQWFHFAEDLLPASDGHGGLMVELNRNGRLIASCNGGETKRIYRGDTEPEVLGWWSPHERVARPRSSWRVVFSDSITTSFTLNNDLVPSRGEAQL